MFNKLMKSALLVVSAFLVVLAGCAGQPGSRPLTAQEVAAKTLAAAETLKDYRMDMEMLSVFEGLVGGEEGKATVRLVSNGEFDLAKMAYRMTMRVSTDLETATPEKQEQEFETYFMDKVVYMKVAGEDGKPAWFKTSLPQGQDFSSALTASELLELLEGVPVELEPEEIVSGTPAYVVKVTPDVGKLFQVLMKEQTDMVPEGIDMAKFLGEAVKGFSFRIWVAKDTFYPLKEDAQMTMVFTSEALGLPQGQLDMRTETSIQVLLHDHNQGVSIAIPAEAGGAVEVPSQ